MCGEPGTDLQVVQKEPEVRVRQPMPAGHDVLHQLHAISHCKDLLTVSPCLRTVSGVIGAAGRDLHPRHSQEFVNGRPSHFAGSLARPLRAGP